MNDMHNQIPTSLTKLCEDNVIPYAPISCQTTITLPPIVTPSIIGT
jgi:hypothetical protein